ncbi:MAG: hypothetical protein ABIO70_31855 [Pseudomonadota bacterium]
MAPLVSEERPAWRPDTRHERSALVFASPAGDLGPPAGRAARRRGDPVPPGCPAGTAAAVIGETGTLYPCEILPTRLGALRPVDRGAARATWIELDTEDQRREMGEGV